MLFETMFGMMFGMMFDMMLLFGMVLRPRTCHVWHDSIMQCKIDEQRTMSTILQDNVLVSLYQEEMKFTIILID
jgi:hypothetical protein